MTEAPGKQRCKFHTMSHEPHKKNVYAILNFGPSLFFQLPVSEVQHEWLDRWVRWKSLTLLVWVTESMCVWQTLPCCQDAAPAITTLSGFLNHHCAFFFFSWWWMAAISAQNLCYKAVTGCVYFQRMHSFQSNFNYTSTFLFINWIDILNLSST